MDKGKNINVYFINYVFGKKLVKMNDNFVMIELKYNEVNNEVFYNYMMYLKFVKYNNKEYINMKGILNGKFYYEFNID